MFFNFYGNRKHCIKIATLYAKEFHKSKDILQRWSQGHKARGQGQGHKKKQDQGQGHKKKKTKAKDNPSDDRPSRGQGQECSRPRTKDTSASVLQKKRSSQKFFRRSPEKNDFQKIFQALHKLLTIRKIVLSSSRGQGNFRGLDLRGQGFQNVSSRTPPLAFWHFPFTYFISLQV